VTQNSLEVGYVCSEQIRASRALRADGCLLHVTITIGNIRLAYEKTHKPACIPFPII
jgi:hypothetical protein